MRWLLLVTPCLVGCMGAPPAGCDGAAALEPASALGLLGLWQEDDEAVAHAWADIVGATITGPGHSDGLWLTPEGHIHVHAGPVPRGVTYTTGAAWTPWDGSGLKADLDEVAAAVVGSEIYVVREVGHNAPADAGEHRWRVLEQRFDGVPMDIDLSAEIVLQGEESFQLVRWEEAFDTQTIDLLPDQEIEEWVRMHLRCAGMTHVRTTSVEEQGFVQDDRFHRWVPATFTDICGDAESRVAIDARTGWADVEKGMTCPT